MEDPMSTPKTTPIIVEYTFDPPITDDEWDAQAERVSECLDVRNVKWVRSYMSLDRRRRICIFEAADAEAVREAYRRGKAKFERVWSAELIEEDPDEEVTPATGVTED
jgi:hypothetical protein